MCTLYCLYCALHCHLLWHSFSSFQDSISIWIHLSNCFVIDYCRLSVSLCIFSFWYRKCISGIWILLTSKCSSSSLTCNNIIKQVNNIIQYKICTWFQFRIGFIKAYSPIRVEEDETVSLMEKSAYLEFREVAGYRDFLCSPARTTCQQGLIMQLYLTISAARYSHLSGLCCARGCQWRHRGHRAQPQPA